MAFEKAVQIGDKEVTIFELTVAQVREMAKATAADASGDPLANWLIEDVPLIVLATMSNIKVEDFDAWRPSEIKQLADKAREVNPDFFDMNRRISAAVEAIRSGALNEISSS
jgi:hypothetical protein